jgi:FkbM family methyltransferase
MQKFIRPFIYKKYMNLVFTVNNLKPIFYGTKTYSDFGEDLFIEKLMCSKDGSYIDIGAGHPIIGSNSYYFYKLGWQGITVEPIKFHNTLHRIVRKRDTKINKLVSEIYSRTILHEFNPTQYSTNSLEQFEDLVKRGMKERKNYYVDTISINQVIRMNKNLNYFLTIDCEGSDSLIIQSIVWDKIIKPKIIIFERIGNKIESFIVNDILLRNQYLLVDNSNNNCIYQLQN